MIHLIQTLKFLSELRTMNHFKTFEYIFLLSPHIKKESSMHSSIASSTSSKGPVVSCKELD